LADLDEVAVGITPQKRDDEAIRRTYRGIPKVLVRYSGQSGARGLTGGFNLEALITNATNAIVETTRNSRVSRVGSEAHPFKERFDCRPLSAARICSAVDNAAGNYQCNLGSGEIT
jgi:hypothetical protein